MKVAGIKETVEFRVDSKWAWPDLPKLTQSPTERRDERERERGLLFAFSDDTLCTRPTCLATTWLGGLGADKFTWSHIVAVSWMLSRPARTQ